MSISVLKAGINQQEINLNSAFKGRYQNLHFTEVKFIQQADNNKAFLDIRGDLYQLEESGEKIKIVPLGISCNIPLINGIEVFDKGSKVFISSQSSGLFLLKKKLFSDSYDKDFPASQSYKSYIELADGNIITNQNTLIDSNQLTKPFEVKKADCFFKFSDSTYYLSLIHISEPTRPY